jgi:hypothetical protein
MKRARYKLLQRMDSISSFPKVMNEVKSLQQKSGIAVSSDLYSKQIESRMEVYNTFVNSISAAVGANTVNIAAVTSAHCNEKQTAAFQAALLKHDALFESHYRLIPEFHFTVNAIVEKLSVSDYSAAVKENIARLIIRNPLCITVDMFENLLPNVDDFFLTLENSDIFESPTSQFVDIRDILSTSLIDAFKNRCLVIDDCLVFQGKVCTVVEVSDEFDSCTIEKPKEHNPEATVKIIFAFNRLEETLTFKRLTSSQDAMLIPVSEPCLLWHSEIDLAQLTNGEFRFTSSQSADWFTGQLSTLDIDWESGVYTFKFDSPEGRVETDIVLQFDKLLGTLSKAEMRGVPMMPLIFQLQFQERAFSFVKNGCKSAINHLFDNVSFKHKYVGMDGIKTTLLEQCEISDVNKKMKIRKKDVQILTRQQAALKLVGILENECVISPPSFNEQCKLFSDVKFRHEITSCLRDLIRKEGITEQHKLIDDLVKVFEGFKEQVKCALEEKYNDRGSDGDVVANFPSVREDMQDGFNFSIVDELTEMELRGVDCLVKFVNKPFWWGPLVVFLLGVVQVIAGAVVSALGFPNIGLALISEGVGDMIYAIEAAISGNFSWNAYLKHKIISLACSILTCGVGSAITSRAGVQIAKAGLKTVVKKVAKKILEAVATALSGLAIDALLDEFFNAIVHAMVKEVDILRAPFQGLEEKLKALYIKTGNGQIVSDFMRNLSASYFDAVKMGELVSRYMHQVLGAIATGIGNAAKVIKHQGGKFKAVAQAAEAFQKMLKVTKYIECIVRALGEMVDFIISIGSKIELKTREAASRNDGKQPHSEANLAFIHSEVEGWKDIMQKRAVDQLKDGILKPEIKNSVNDYLRRMGRSVKEGIGLAGRLEDKKYKANLLQVRTRNLSVLASSDRMFFKRDLQCPADIVGKNELDNAIDLPDDQLLENADGHTVGSIKNMIPGVVFYKTTDGRLIILPPDMNNQPISKIAIDALYEQNGRYSLSEEQYKLKKSDVEGEADHSIPVVNGEEIHLVPINGLCDEQTRLFWDKLNRLEHKYGDSMTKSDKIAKAKSYAEKSHKVLKLRYDVLTNLPDSFRGNETLRRMVGSVHDSKVGYVSLDAYLRSCLLLMRNQSPKEVNEIRHANELQSQLPNRFRGPTDESKAAEIHLQGVSSAEVKAVLNGSNKFDKELVHLRACAALFYDMNGNPTTAKNSQLYHELQAIKHIWDPRNGQMMIHLTKKAKQTNQPQLLATVGYKTAIFNMRTNDPDYLQNISKNILDKHHATLVVNILANLP